MSECSTCSIQDCNRDAAVRGWCRMHYKRWSRLGDPLAGGPPRVVRDATCTVEGCTSAHDARGFCQSHYRRLKLYGSPLASAPRVNSGLCSVDGCDGPARTRGWCATHYNQWRRKGEVRPLKHKWRAERGPCEVCSRAVPEDARTRRFCSDSCARIHYASGGAVDIFAKCNRCGESIDRRPDGKRGWIRDDVLLCKPCRHAGRRGYGASAVELAQRDGTDCSLCGEAVDMSLTRAESIMCPSVDHVVPYSLGGSNDAENLALAHLRCNQMKLNRVGWSAIA